MKKITTLFVFSVLGIFLLTGNVMATTWTEIDDPGYFTMAPGADKATFTLVFEEAAFAGENTFGYYHEGQAGVELFSGPDYPIDAEMEHIDGQFGFYISTPEGDGHTYYSDVSMNEDGYDHFKVLQDDNDPDRLKLKIEDLLQPGWDTDHNDMVIVVKNVNAVPIPGAVWLLGSGLMGLVGIRRKFVK